MKVAAVTILCLVMTGCASLTPRQKSVAVAVGAALVVGAIAAHDSSDGRVKIPTDPGRASAY